jgi:hypothetical protein
MWSWSEGFTTLGEARKYLGIDVGPGLKAWSSCLSLVREAGLFLKPIKRPLSIFSILKSN